MFHEADTMVFTYIIIHNMGILRFERSSRKLFNNLITSLTRLNLDGLDKPFCGSLTTFSGFSCTLSYMLVYPTDILFS